MQSEFLAGGFSLVVGFHPVFPVLAGGAIFALNSSRAISA